MNVLPLAALVAAVSYLVGAVPFGLIVARARGVDLLKHGSGNIGATNVGRALGLKWGLLVFLLDFLKGAGPTLAAGFLPPPADAVPWPDALRALAAVSAFLGHLFPVYLGFRGGKGVATGGGAVLVLVPVAALLAAATWAVVLYGTRYMSLASIASVVVLTAACLLLAPDPFGPRHAVATCFAAAASAAVVARHVPNLRRLMLGTENRL